MDQLPEIPREARRHKRLRLKEHATSEPGSGEGIEELIATQVVSDARTICVTYDVRITALDHLVAQLLENGIDVAGDRRARLRIAWQSYLDRNARANLMQPASPCCSNPTSVYASRKKR